MRKMRKRLLLCLLAAVLLLVQVCPAFATGGATDWNTYFWNSNQETEKQRAARIEAAANALYEMGLIKGSGTNPDGTPNLNLGATFTRGEGATMITNLMGGNQEAINGDYPNPYTDDLSWAKPFVLYATAHNLVSGTGNGEFDIKSPMDVRQFLVMLLRMTGYWETANISWEQSPEYAVTCGLDVPRDWQTAPYTRGDAILACYSALDLLVGEEDNLTTFKYTLEMKGAIPSDRILDTGFTRGPVYPTQREIAVTDASQVEKNINLMLRTHVQTYRVRADGVSLQVVLDALGRKVYAYRGIEMYYGGNEAFLKMEYIGHEQVIGYLEGRTNTMDDLAWGFMDAALELHPTLVDPSMSEYEQVLAFHDYIVNNTEYDLFAPGYGTLVSGTGVCEDYAMTFALLCWLSGIDCRYVTGQAYGGGEWGEHAWNKVKVDGTWYNVDLTFDDPVVISNIDIGGVCLYDNFLKSDTVFKQDHYWEDCSFWPACNFNWDMTT